MADDLFKDCDCGDCGDCGDCDCGDCDCDCDCNCDDCLPDNNIIVICCCIPPPTSTSSSDPNKTRGAGTSTDCFPCCCCCNQRSYGPRRRQERRKKKGFCWRLCCCFARNDPSPTPSPPRPSRGELPPGGRYPMPDDLDFYMNERWAGHPEFDMPPRGYRPGPGGRYPMHEAMRMYRDENYGLGGRWNMRDPSLNDYYRHDGRAKGEGRSMASRDYYEHYRWAKRDLGKASKDGRRDEENTRQMVLDAPPMGYHGRDQRQDKPDEVDLPPRRRSLDERSSSSEELGMPRGHYPRHDKVDDGMPHQDLRLKGKWSSPVKYKEPP